MNDSKRVYELDEDQIVGCYFCMADGHHASYRRGEAFLADADHSPYDGNANYVCRAHLDSDAVVTGRARREETDETREDKWRVSDFIPPAPPTLTDDPTCSLCGGPASRHSNSFTTACPRSESSIWRESVAALRAAFSQAEESRATNAALLDRAYQDIAALRAEVAALRAQGGGFDLDAFSRENLDRCESPTGFNHRLSSWSLSDWMTATLGELGEAANIAKKLNRVRDGIIGNDETEDELRRKFASEIADAFIYLDLMAQSQGMRLSEAVRHTFDAKSDKIGYCAARSSAAGEDTDG